MKTVNTEKSSPTNHQKLIKQMQKNQRVKTPADIKMLSMPYENQQYFYMRNVHISDTRQKI